MNCPACGLEIPAAATFCPACRQRGQSVPSVVAPAPLARKVAPPATPPVDDKHERLFLVVAVLLSAGALAIPRVRKTRAFGPRGRAILIGLALLQTALVLAVLASLPWAAGKWFDYVQRQSLHRRRF